jgi:hypothetical protein
MTLRENSLNLKALSDGGSYRALKAVEANYWPSFSHSCKYNADCQGELQKCTNLLWEAKNDNGATFASGNACYDWKVSPC